LCELDLTALWALLQDENIVKVLHSPSEDLEVFMRYGQCIPKPLFDTQFALSLLGERNCVGFANMVEMLLDKKIDKSESRTNWLKRPLTPAQLDYAAADVFYLLPCYQLIKQKMSEQQVAIVYSEGELIATKRAYKAPLDRVYLDIKNSWQLNPIQLSVLRELAAWRKQTAEKKNLALNFIVHESMLFEIAQTMPRNFSSLKRICQGDQNVLNRHGKMLLQLVQIGLDKEASECPASIKRLIDFTGYKPALKDIRNRLEEVANRSGIPLDVLASKKQMNQLISWNWKENSDTQNNLLKPDLMNSWRKQWVADALSDWL
jgi:ribonuclease D